MADNPHYIPNGFTAVTPYLIVNGASALLEFVKRVFDAEETYCMRDDDGKIRHASARIYGSMIELSDAGGPWTPIPAALHVYVEDPDAVYKKAIEAGATSIYEPADHFYGERSGGVVDPSGVTWYIAAHREDVSDEELRRRQAAMKGR